MLHVSHFYYDDNRKNKYKIKIGKEERDVGKQNNKKLECTSVYNIYVIRLCSDKKCGE